MKRIFENILPVATVLLLLVGCGDAVIDLDNQTFEPKIVMNAVLHPGQPVRNFKIGRNFPLNTRIDDNEIFIPDASVILRDSTGEPFQLSYNSAEECYEYRGTDLEILYNARYSLEVNATIDGESLSASSTTTTPGAGVTIREELSTLDSLFYRQRDDDGNLINFDLVFDRSPGTDYYVASIVALDAEIESFIFDNPFGDITEQDVEEDFNDFRAPFTWIQDTPLTPGISNIEIFSFFTWFYGNYRAVLYAGDSNLEDFVSTYNQVQEIDGNFHEPALHIDGDGIGVFGSAVTDTAFFHVRFPIE